ncbi:decarboxylating 6-phosphogluconate dehydrogenase [Marinihelvus fidelis]|uniref:Decarboxylating 6-phosphogluconate dehydrogenase n=2 Tax=Marinihelvus fidelis TaxID=2613842 RepID=A0A5N0THA6_9GAMM|nr:decarboxylating 6-phosphogluconate dehydrogenase [Marinihelvus fidelis]
MSHLPTWSHRWSTGWWSTTPGRQSNAMRIGMIGLGRMGGSMAQRLINAGHEVVAYDVNDEAVAALSANGADGASSIAELVDALPPPRHVWMMVPVAFVDGLVEQLAPLLDDDDVLIDGGNSHYPDDIRRAATLSELGIHYVDCGVSGGVWGAERGYCLMIGGKKAVVKRLQPVFEALAPGADSAPRTPGRKGEPTPEEQGWLHCGPTGAGHFVKMVHNGIEYGLMAAYAEGLNLLAHGGIGHEGRERDAETTPLDQPEHFQFDFEIDKVTELWRRGSVVGSWLLDLTAQSLHADPALSKFAGRVSDSGEGRWTVQAAIEAGVPLHVISAAVFDRFSSRDEGEYAGKVLSAMRHAFGGHAEKPE